VTARVMMVSMKDTLRKIDDSALEEIIRRIVEVAAPDRIILFGSAARGEMGPNSDLDLLVIKSGNVHRGHLAEEIYVKLHGVNYAVDVIVVTPEDVEKYRDTHALVIAPAVREGQVVYDA
jgi:predicted nucleotidyltransferase